jgi:tRNA(Ile)-lysidine synthase
MLRRVQQTIIDRNLIRKGAHIVAAVSGGADSTALLYALWFLRDRLSFRLSAAHLHHGLRGNDADRDAEFVEQLCARLKIPLRLECVVPGSLERRGESVEMAARKARHEFFQRTLLEFQADVVALAHHRDDQAETVLMRVLSGSGIDGLGGIDYANEPLPGLPVIRPMLDVSRKQIEHFLRTHRRLWREDKSNQRREFMRNRIRRVIIPRIEKERFTGVAQSLVKIAEIMREESVVLAKQTSRLAKCCIKPGQPNALYTDRVARLPVAEQRRVLRAWLSGCVTGERTIDFQRIEKIRNMLCDRESLVFALDSTSAIRKTGKTLVVEQIKQKKADAEWSPVKLRVPGVTVMEKAGLVVTVKSSNGYKKQVPRIGQYPAVAYIRRDAKNIPEFILRSRRPGDRLSPTGMSGSVTLKDLLINQKIPVEQRSKIPVLACGSEVVWVAGYRVAQSWSVLSSKSPSWRIQIEIKHQ